MGRAAKITATSPFDLFTSNRAGPNWSFKSQKHNYMPASIIAKKLAKSIGENPLWNAELV